MSCLKCLSPHYWGSMNPSQRPLRLEHQTQRSGAAAQWTSTLQRQWQFWHLFCTLYKWWYNTVHSFMCGFFYPTWRPCCYLSFSILVKHSMNIPNSFILIFMEFQIVLICELLWIKFLKTTTKLCMLLLTETSTFLLYT